MNIAYYKNDKSYNDALSKWLGLLCKGSYPNAVGFAKFC